MFLYLCRWAQTAHLQRGLPLKLATYLISAQTLSWEQFYCFMQTGLDQWYKIVGIDEIEADSTKIENQRSKNNALKQARIAPGRPHGRPVEKAGRPHGRPVCTTCTGIVRSTIAKSGRPHGRPTNKALLSVPVDRAGRPWHGSVNRPVNRQTRFGCPFWIRTSFLFGVESNQDFLKAWDSAGINKG